MKTIKLFFIFLGSAFILSGLTGCQKDEEKSPEVITAEDDAVAEEMFNAVFYEVEDALEYMENALYGGAKKAAFNETCKVITVDIPGDTVIWPKTITIDYGDGCMSPSGRVRKGKIIIVVSDRVFSPEYTRTITFDNFYIDDYKIEGTKTIARNGKNESGNPLFTINLEDGKVITPEGKTFTRKFNRVREWVTGYTTPRYRLDDEYMVTGTASGTDRNGTEYTRTIVLPLHIKNGCPWVISGSVRILKSGKQDALLDYGNDVCDRVATVTVGDKTWTILLHR